MLDPVSGGDHGVAATSAEARLISLRPGILPGPVAA
jgi:hypothetical protein